MYVYIYIHICNIRRHFIRSLCRRRTKTTTRDNEICSSDGLPLFRETTRDFFHPFVFLFLSAYSSLSFYLYIYPLYILFSLANTLYFYICMCTHAYRLVNPTENMFIFSPTFFGYKNIDFYAPSI